jgi:thiol-disulfide isomerase/thioredoxin
MSLAIERSTLTDISTVLPPQMEAAPELNLAESIGDEVVRLESLRGRVVLLNFWTVNCLACRNLIPILNRWQKSYAEHGFQVVGIHTPQTDEERKLSRLLEALKDIAPAYPVLADQGRRLAQAYRLPTWPSLYLLDRQGRIRAVQAGTGGVVEMETRVRGLLFGR